MVVKPLTVILYLRFCTLLFLLLLCAHGIFAQNTSADSKALPITQSTGSFQAFPRTVRPSSSESPSPNGTVLRSQAFSFPVSDCFTYTYKLTVSNGGKLLETKDMYTASDDNTYLVGSAENNGQQDGLIEQLDVYGNLAWSKCIGRTDREEVINSVRQLASGDLVVIGTSALSGGTDTFIFLARLDKDGNLIWFKTLNSFSGYNGIAISPFQKTIGFAGSDDSTIVYGGVDDSGNVMWLKKMQLMEKGSVIGMTNNDFDRWLISYSGVDSVHYVTAIAAVNSADGKMLWVDRYGGQAQNSNFIIHDHAWVNNRARFSGIYSENGGEV